MYIWIVSRESNSFFCAAPGDERQDRATCPVESKICVLTRPCTIKDALQGCRTFFSITIPPSLLTHPHSPQRPHRAQPLRRLWPPRNVVNSKAMSPATLLCSASSVSVHIVGHSSVERWVSRSLCRPSSADLRLSIVCQNTTTATTSRIAGSRPLTGTKPSWRASEPLHPSWRSPNRRPVLLIQTLLSAPPHHPVPSPQPDPSAPIITLRSLHLALLRSAFHHTMPLLDVFPPSQRSRTISPSPAPSHLPSTIVVTFHDWLYRVNFYDTPCYNST